MDAEGEQKRDGFLAMPDGRLKWLDPRVRPTFVQLADTLVSDHRRELTKTLFKPFEAYRTPQRQQKLFDMRSGVTGAAAFQSAHNFGLAVDFVPRIEHDSRWSWDGSHDWDHLAKRARELGLVRPYSWDLAHIESPLWNDLRHVMRSL